MEYTWKLLKNKNTQIAKVPRTTISERKKLVSGSICFVVFFAAGFAAAPDLVAVVFFAEVFVFFFVDLFSANEIAPFSFQGKRPQVIVYKR